MSCDSIRLTLFLILARMFVKHNDPVILLKFISEVSEMVFSQNEIVPNRLIFAFDKCGHVDKALFVFDNMKSLECKPDLVTYNTILGILGQLGKVDEMLHEFVRFGDPNYVEYFENIFPLLCILFYWEKYWEILFPYFHVILFTFISRDFIGKILFPLFHVIFILFPSLWFGMHP